MSQEQLGGPLGLDRSAVSRIESGARTVDSLELSQIANRLGRPIEWFVRPRPTTVVSRRVARAGEQTTPADLGLEDLVADVELLLELGALEPTRSARRRHRSPLRSTADAERLARAARQAAGVEPGPLGDLVTAAERLGMLVFVLDLPQAGFDGSYVALPDCGVALVAGGLASGKRRFTIVHELGHHFLQDEFDTYVDAPVEKGSRERLIDAFTIHFLMPRKDVVPRFRSLLATGEDERGAALHLGQEYGLSWTALCAQLKSLGLVSEALRRRLAADVPTRAEFFERGLALRQERAAPVLPGGFTSAVLRAYRARKVSAARAIQMLRGGLNADELPGLKPVPVESFRGDIECRR